jgi:hypothetical protein
VLLPTGGSWLPKMIAMPKKLSASIRDHFVELTDPTRDDERPSESLDVLQRAAISKKKPTRRNVSMGLRQLRYEMSVAR